MTPSDAALREALLELFKRADTKQVCNVWAFADEAMELLQSEKQQLLADIKGYARGYEVTDLELLDHRNETPLVAVPVSVLEGYQKQGKGGE